MGKAQPYPWRVSGPLPFASAPLLKLRIAVVTHGPGNRRVVDGVTAD